MSATTTVTLPRAEYERLLTALEDAEDRATLAAAREQEFRLGRQEARRDHLPVELVERLFAGESPVRVWREHRVLPMADLARAAALSVAELAAIETGMVAPEQNVVVRLAGALMVSPDELSTPAT